MPSYLGQCSRTVSRTLGTKRQTNSIHISNSNQESAEAAVVSLSIFHCVWCGWINTSILTLYCDYARRRTIFSRIERTNVRYCQSLVPLVCHCMFLAHSLNTTDLNSYTDCPPPVMLSIWPKWQRIFMSVLQCLSSDYVLCNDEALISVSDYKES